MFTLSEVSPQPPSISPPLPLPTLWWKTITSLSRKRSMQMKVCIPGLRQPHLGALRHSIHKTYQHPPSRPRPLYYNLLVSTLILFSIYFSISVLFSIRAGLHFRLLFLPLFNSTQCHSDPNTAHQLTHTSLQQRLHCCNFPSDLYWWSLSFFRCFFFSVLRQDFLSSSSRVCFSGSSVVFECSQQPVAVLCRGLFTVWGKSTCFLPKNMGQPHTNCKKNKTKWIMCT